MRRTESEPRQRHAVLVALALLLSAPALAPAGPSDTATYAATAQVPEIDERLRAEEAWAAEEFARKERERAGGAPEPAKPPPGRKSPLPSWLVVLLGISGGVGWGLWHRRRGRARRS